MYDSVSVFVLQKFRRKHVQGDAKDDSQVEPPEEEGRTYGTEEEVEKDEEIRGLRDEIAAWMF